MKILFLCRWDTRFPTDGQLLYSDGILSSLERLDADVTVLATLRPDTAHLPQVRSRMMQAPSPWPKPLSLFSSLSNDAFKQRTSSFITALREALDEQPDVIIFEYYATGWALDIVLGHYERKKIARPLLVYISHNHEASLRSKVATAYRGNAIMRCIVKRDAAKVVQMENKLVANCDLVFAITEQDAELYRQSFPDKRYEILLPAYNGGFREAGLINADTPKRVIMMGSLIWIAKKENIRRFIVEAREKFEKAGVELVLIGRSEPEFLESLRKLSPCVTTLGFVEDPIPLLHASRIGLMPDELGGGFKLRVMDYVFNGVPVAAIRSQTKGLPLDPGQDMIAADGVKDLVNQIILVIDDIDRLNTMARQAESNCAGKFDWDSRGSILLRALSEARADLSAPNG
jgi:glycosyltransferase involved in cell wall biosynthesis